jgi:hypothetical protein
VNSDGVGKHIVEDEELFNSTSSVDEYKELLSIDSPKAEPKEEVEVEEEDSEVAELKELSELKVPKVPKTPEEIELNRIKAMDRIRELERMQNSSAVKECNYSATSDTYEGDTSNAPADAKEDSHNSLEDKKIQLIIKKDMDEEAKANKNNLPWNNEWQFSDGRVLKINKENKSALMNKLPEFGTLVNYYMSKEEPRISCELVHGPVLVTLGSILADVPDTMVGTLKDDIERMKNGYRPLEENKGARLYSSVSVDYGKGHFSTNHGRIVLARSGTNKDSLNIEGMAKNHCSTATKEGFYDTLIEHPANLFVNGELADFFRSDKAYNTGVMNAYKEFAFKTDLNVTYSKNSKNPIKRITPFIAPSMYSRTTNKSWFDLLYDNVNLKTDGTIRRNAIDMLDSPVAELTIGVRPTLPKSIKHNGRIIELNNSIEPILNIYRSFRLKLELERLPRRLFELKTKLHEGYLRQVHYEPLEAEIRTDQWSVIEHFINMNGLKYYFILKPYLNNGEYNIEDDHIWDCVIMQILYDIQMSERCVFVIKNKNDDRFNMQIDKLKRLCKRYNVNRLGVRRLYDNKWLKGINGESLNMHSVAFLCQRISDCDSGFYYDKQNRMLMLTEVVGSVKE